MTKRRKGQLTDDEIIADLGVSESWQVSSLGTPIGADGINDEVAWSRFQRVCINHARTYWYPAGGEYSIVPQAALGRRSRQPDILVRQAASVVAVIDAKERRRLDTRDVVDVVEKYSRLAYEITICVPPRCIVAASARREARRRGVRIEVVPFGDAISPRSPSATTHPKKRPRKRKRPAGRSVQSRARSRLAS